MSGSELVSPIMDDFPPTPAGNRLLGMILPQAENFFGSQPHYEDLPEGALAWDTGDEVSDVFFPISGMLSVRVLTSDGHAIEVASVGREGAAGLYKPAGRLPAATQAVVAVPGRFARFWGHAFGIAARVQPEIGSLMEACDGWMLRQSQMKAACNACHSADRRFCCYLLRVSDALGSNFIPLTQETIAQSLGIRRTTATLIAHDLQQRGIMSYRRGKIVISERDRLETAACDCRADLGHRYWPCFNLRRANGQTWQQIQDDDQGTSRP